MAVTDQAPDSVGVRDVVGGRPAAGVSLGSGQLSDFIQWIQGAFLNVLFDYDGVGRLEYIGKGKFGAKTSDAAWQITRLYYNGAGKNADVIDMRIPVIAGGGDPDLSDAGFVHIYDDRASLTYPDPRA